MAASDGGSFRLITVNEDEEELVVHAGSGRREQPVGAPAGQTAEQPAPATAPNEETAGAAAAPAPESARQEELRRRAEELAQAEAGLEDPHTFSRMRMVVLVALAALVIAFVVYLVGLPH